MAVRVRLEGEPTRPHLPLNPDQLGPIIGVTGGRMLRLSRLTDYAVVLLVRLGDGRGVVTSTLLASETGIPEPTVAKVLKTLAAAGLVSSQRGARGGYRIARGLDTIAVADVVEAIDGPVAIASCESDAPSCPTLNVCPVRGGWEPLNTAIRATLTRMTLADMRINRASLPA